MTNLELWDSVQTTDPEFTKQFNRGGGFSGTSINATYLAKRATETFGPVGIGWGVDIEKEDFLQGHVISEDGQRWIIHCVRIALWYDLDGKRGVVHHFGQTTFVGTNKNGPFTDEEAPKKSLTDATNKALSMLGFSSDIHMGLYDDQEYRQEVTNHHLLEKADDKDAERARIHDEYITWRKDHLHLTKTATNRSELKTLYTLMARKMNRHNDTGGLRILEETKKESLERIEAAEREDANVNAARAVTGAN